VPVIGRTFSLGQSGQSVFRSPVEKIVARWRSLRDALNSQCAPSPSQIETTVSHLARRGSQCKGLDFFGHLYDRARGRHEAVIAIYHRCSPSTPQGTVLEDHNSVCKVGIDGRLESAFIHQCAFPDTARAHARATEHLNQDSVLRHRIAESCGCSVRATTYPPRKNTHAFPDWIHAQLRHAPCDEPDRPINFSQCFGSTPGNTL
jgi:hypothetical protein